MVRLGELLKKLGIMATLLILMGGCKLASQKPAIDRSILTDDPCAAPCWQGIVPGQTTMDEAVTILDTLGIDYHRFDREVQWHSELYYRGDGFDFSRNVLYGPKYGESACVVLVRLGLEFELTLQQILDKYGPPQKFQATRSELPALPDGHTPGIIVSLFYPERGLAFEIWLPGLLPARLESDTTLKAVIYFTPTTMERLFIDIPETTTYLRGDTWKELQDWQGLGLIPEVHSSGPAPSATAKSTAQELQVQCNWASAVCAPPCWEGILPGVTTLEEALDLLQESNLVARSTIREGAWLGGVWPGKTQILWSDIGWETSEDALISSGYPNMLLAKDGIVEWMLLRLDPSTECSPMIMEIVDRYGIPAKILRGEAGYTPEIMWEEMDLLFPAHGLVFVSPVTGHSTTIYQQDRLNAIYCFPPTSLDALMAQPVQFDFQKWYTESDETGKVHSTWAEELEDWPGFDR